MDKAKMKKIGEIVLNVLMYVFLAICIFVVFVTVSSKKTSDSAAEIFGYQMRIVTSDSMAKCEHTDVSAYKIKDIPIRSMIFVQVMPKDSAKADDWYRDLKVGDVLTFRYVYTTQVTITHRITSIEEKETGGFIIELAGDNTTSEDGQLTQVIDTSIPYNTNYVIGKVTGQSYLFGAVMSFLMQPLGMVLLIIVPCFGVILFEVVKIVKVLTEDKKKKDQEEKKQKDDELEELRRKLAELEKAKNESQPQDATDSEAEQTVAEEAVDEPQEEDAE
jgi:uncharacterized membrane protein